MNDPLTYHKPGLDDEAMRRRKRAQQIMWVGTVTFVVCVGLSLLPLLIGGKIGKFVVAFAFVGACWGLGCVVHGVWDWWRG